MVKQQQTTCGSIQQINLLLQKEAYIVEEFIGKGGMACVYKARIEHEAHPYALKLLQDSFRKNEQFMRYFRSEADALRNLQHPNIVRFYRFHDTSDYSYIIMDYIDGKSLSKHLKEKQLTIDDAVRTMVQIARAISSLHKENFVHRDIKSSNILIENETGKVYLGDFGVVADLDTAQLREVVGTPYYMPYEQHIGETLDKSADNYAFAVLVYEMLTGVRPFNLDGQNLSVQESREYLKQQHRSGTVPSVTQHNSSLPPSLDRIFERALAKNPSKRYQNVMHFAQDIHVALESMLADSMRDFVSIGARPLLSQPETHHKSSIGRLTMSALVVVLLLVGAGLFLQFGMPDNTEETAVVLKSEATNIPTIEPTRMIALSTDVPTMIPTTPVQEVVVQSSNSPIPNVSPTDILETQQIVFTAIDSPSTQEIPPTNTIIPSTIPVTDTLLPTNVPPTDIWLPTTEQIISTDTAVAPVGESGTSQTTAESTDVSPTSTTTETATATVTPTNTATATFTPTYTATPTLTLTQTPLPTVTHTFTPTAIPTLYLSGEPIYYLMEGAEVFGIGTTASEAATLTHAIKGQVVPLRIGQVNGFHIETTYSNLDNLAEYGVVFHYVDDQNFVVLRLMSADSEWSIDRVTDGMWENLDHARIDKLPNNIIISGKENLLLIQLANILIQYNTQSWNNGSVGVWHIVDNVDGEINMDAIRVALLGEEATQASLSQPTVVPPLYRMESLLLQELHALQALSSFDVTINCPVFVDITNRISQFENNVALLDDIHDVKRINAVIENRCIRDASNPALDFNDTYSDYIAWETNLSNLVQEIEQRN